MNSFMDSFPPREPHGVTQNSHRGCSAAIWWMTWSPEKAPAPPALVWEDAVVGEQTYEPHVKWSIFTGQDPQGQEGPNPSDMSHSEALEVLGASDSPSCPSAHIPVTRQPLSLLTQHHRHPFLPGAEHSAGSPGRRSHGQHLVLLLLSGTMVGSRNGERTQPSSCQGERVKYSLTDPQAKLREPS